jgi:hypothetical protein
MTSDNKIEFFHRTGHSNSGDAAVSGSEHEAKSKSAVSPTTLTLAEFLAKDPFEIEVNPGERNHNRHFFLKNTKIVLLM